MKLPDITPLRNKFIIYTGIASLLSITTLIIIVINLLDVRINIFLEKEHQKIHHAIEGLQSQSINRYDYLSKRIIETTSMKAYLKNKKREKLYEYFEKKWHLLQKENPYLTILGFHNPDGTMFLRMHKQDKYGDRIDNIRPMIKEVHKNHKKLIGYETGKYSTVLRVITPIFDDGKYIGALDIGVNPNYLLKQLIELLGYKSVLFVKNSSLLINKNIEKKFQLEDYTLVSDIDSTMERNLKKLASDKYDLNDNMHIKMDGGTQYIHIFPIIDYTGKVTAKIIFFQNLSIWDNLRNSLLFLVVGIVSLFSLFLFFFIFRGSSNVQITIENLYKRYLGEIQKSQEYFKELFQSAPLSYQSLDGEGNILTVNNQWIKELGYSEEEIIGKNFTAILTSEFKNKFHQNFPKFKDAGGIEDIEFDMLKKSGEVITVSYSGKIIYNDDKTVLKTHCIFINITQQKKQLNKIAFNEAYLDSVFNTIPNIVFTTFGKKIDRVNKKLLDFTNYDSIADFKENHNCFCDYFEVEDGYISTDIDGQNWLDYIYVNPQLEHRVKIKNGEEHTIFIINTQRLSFDENERSIIVLNDITELENLSLSLQRSSDFTNSIIDSIDNLIFVKDNNFNYIACNRAFEQFLNRSKADIVGYNDYDFFDKEIADFFRSKDKEMLATNKSKSNFEWVTHADGRKMYLLTVTSPLATQEGDLIGLVANSADFTKQKNLEDEIKLKEEMMIAQSRHAAMGEMIGMIAHQWRQPITSIAMGANNIIVDATLGNLDKDSLNELATEIIDQTQYLSKTIDDFRDFFKPNKTRVDTNVCSVIEETLSIIATSFSNHNITVLKEFNSQTIISTYSRELLQVYINILKNAKEALLENKTEDATISIKVTENENDIVTTICDNAGGIKPELLTKIFEPYFTTKDEKTGTGLGLYMSSTIVDKHLKGSLSVENSGDGVCFTVTLPKSISEGGGNKQWFQ